MEKILINGGDISENKLFLTIDIEIDERDSLIALIKSKLGEKISLQDISDFFGENFIDRL